MTLLDSYEALVCDLDGVVYRGPAAVPHAVEALRSCGLRVLYATNNASRTPETVASHLTGLGLQAGPDDVVTSAQAGAHYLAEHLPAGSAVLGVGGAGIVEALGQQGLRAVPVADARSRRRRPVGRCAPGLWGGAHRRRPCRGGVCRAGRRAVGGHQHRPHPAHRPRHRPRQRHARRRRGGRRRPPSGGGRQTARPAVPPLRRPRPPQTRPSCSPWATGWTPTSRARSRPEWTPCSC